MLTLTKIEEFKALRNIVLKVFSELPGELKCQIVIVQEVHKDGSFHLHAVILICVGLNKNSYRKIVRGLFPDFTGRGIDVRGIRNLSFTFKYLLKEVTNKKDVVCFNIDWKELLEKAKITELLMLEEMVMFNNKIEWVNSSLKNKHFYITNKNKCNNIWEISQYNTCLSLKEVIEHLKDTPYRGMPFFLKFDAIFFLFKLALIFFSTCEWKQTNILLVGKPNCGKSRFFKKLEECCGMTLYWAPRRAGDFSNFKYNTRIIIIDDIISSKNIWPIAFLLKCLGREGFTADAKIQTIFNIPAGVPVAVCTNFPGYFTNNAAIQARLSNCYLFNNYNWLRLGKEEFKGLINLFKDIIESNHSIITLKDYKYISTPNTNPLVKGDIFRILCDNNNIGPLLSILSKDSAFLFFHSIFWLLNEHLIDNAPNRDLIKIEITIRFLKEYYQRSINTNWESFKRD